MPGVREARIHSLPEALARLCSPSAQEELATLTGEGILWVDLPPEDQGRLSQEILERALAGLERLACPTLARVPPEANAAIEALAEGFDLRVDASEDPSLLLQAIDHAPLASLALVQLLRHNVHCDLHQGLIAESWVYSTLQAGPEFRQWRADHSGRVPQEPERPVLRVERQGEELALTLDHPARHNAFGVALRDALAEAFRLAATDDSIHRLVMQAEGPSFCSGGDLDEFGHAPDPATAHAIRSTRHPARILCGLPQESSAKLHGACIGAGIELPAFMTHVAARRNSFFALPEVGMGLVPGAGGTVSLPRRIGRQRTARLAITGERIDAVTAQQWGLVDQLIP
ncbi:MAG: enoyl-CoA hydratase/isomerase family protein [Myxococcota bacterium]|nr:enoyl-CoA hydratase/isomerase family protein [Myxococcota bacterium]